MIIPLNPIFQERIWGGTTLSRLFDVSLKDKKIGECWGISALPEHSCHVHHPSFPPGTTLYDLWTHHKEYFGHHPADAFPILVKLIDAQEDLSIQVHPNDAQAKPFHSLGKSECWKILNCAPDSRITIGHFAQSKEEILQAIEHRQVESIVQTFPIQPGDFFFIEAGTLHAIRKNTFLLEVQQSSDITYRFYDYDREDHGQKRPLHIQEALDVLKVPDRIIHQEMVMGYFDLEFVEIQDNSSIQSDRYGDYIVILEGEGTLDEIPLKAYQFYMITAHTDYTIKGNLKLARIRLI
jgi:mannose-6-phosphate isomerase class I